MASQSLENTALSNELDHYQTKLLPFAYNILGDVLAAQDVVQEVLNKFFLSPQPHVEHKDKYLTRSVINKAINQKDLLRNRKEQYLGTWLPTPVFTEESIYKKADSSKLIHYSLMVLLEALNPRERAVFILKETFDFLHSEIADILEITIDHSRQLLKRSKQKIAEHTFPLATTDSPKQPVLQKLTEAIAESDIEEIKKLLTADIKCISDGGNKARAARKTIAGREYVFKFLQAVHDKYLLPGTSLEFTTVNHSPAIVYRLNETIYRCLVIELQQGVIHKIFIIVNPDKLVSLN